MAERLRREGARVHEDTRFEVGAARPLADLRHVLGECPGLPDRARRVEGLVMALDEMAEMVPERPDTLGLLQLTRAVRAALEASDQGRLTEARWKQVDAVLAAFVPDFAREGSTPAARRELIQAVVEALQRVHGRAAGAVREWQAAHRHELERRRDQERFRGLLRTVMRAWREQADGRCACSMRVALPTGQLVVQGAPAGRLGTDCLPTVHTTVQPRRPTAREEGQTGTKAAAEARLHQEMMEREVRCEGGNGVLPVARSAAPAGTQARLLLTYIRLVEGGRLRRRRWEFWPEHRVGVGRKAFVMTAGYPARQDLLARIERVRLLELKEGVRRPVEDYGPDARASRRRGRAEMLHDAGAGDQRREDGGGSTQLDGRETEHGMGALDGEAGGGGCAMGVGMQRHQRGGEVENGGSTAARRRQRTELGKFEGRRY